MILKTLNTILEMYICARKENAHTLMQRFFK